VSMARSAARRKDARRELPKWGLALLMRPAKAAPGVPFVNSPLCQRPNVCVTNYRGVSDPVVPYKPPRLLSVYISRLRRGCRQVKGSGLRPQSSCSGYNRFTEGSDTLDLKQAKECDFAPYVDLVLTKSHMRVGRAGQIDTGEVGQLGYWLAAIEFAGFLVGGAATFLFIRGMARCGRQRN
jgi:hypothetical protein